MASIYTFTGPGFICGFSLLLVLFSTTKVIIIVIDLPILLCHLLHTSGFGYSSVKQRAVCIMNVWGYTEILPHYFSCLIYCMNINYDKN